MDQEMQQCDECGDLMRGLHNDGRCGWCHTTTHPDRLSHRARLRDQGVPLEQILRHAKPAHPEAEQTKQDQPSKSTRGSRRASAHRTSGRGRSPLRRHQHDQHDQQALSMEDS